MDAESVSRHFGDLYQRFGETGEAADGNVESSFWSQLQLDQFSDAELTTIFSDFSIEGNDQIAALRALPIHLTIGGERASIGRRSYLEDPSRGFRLDDGLLAEIVVFRCESDPGRKLRQERLFAERRLTAATIVRLAAAENEVPVHWSTVLCALSEVDRHSDLEALRIKSWVPTRTGFVAPIDVPYLPELDLRQELPDVQLTCATDLLPDFLGHEHFDAGRELLLTAGEALGYLGRKLSDHDRYLLGPPEVADLPLEDFLQAFEGDGECMPCHSLLKRLVEHTSAESCRKNLVQRLLKPIQASERWIAILSHLAKQNASDGNRAGVRKLFDVYLAGAKHHPLFKSRILPSIRLLSASRGWRPTNKLCVDWPGVSSSNLLHADHIRILGLDARQRNEPTQASDSAEFAVAAPSLIEEADRSAATLKRYFSGWSSVPPGAVAGFLSLLGNHSELVDYVEELVQPRRISSIRDAFPWEVPPAHVGGGGWSANEAIRRCRIIVRLDKSSTIQALNLLGDSFEAPASDSPSHLLMGAPEPIRDKSMRIVQDGLGHGQL